MLSLHHTQVSAKDQYKILIGSVIPRPIAFVTTQSQEGIVNLAPFSFYNIVSYNPAILSISVQRLNGQMKDTTRNILKQGEAVIHNVSLDNVAQVNQSAKDLSYNDSELKRTGMTLVPSSTIKTPGVKEASVRFETELYQHVPIRGEQGSVIADLLLLKIRHYHLDEAVYQDTYINYEHLNPLSRLAGNDYAQLGELHTLKRP